MMVVGCSWLAGSWLSVGWPVVGCRGDGFSGRGRLWLPLLRA